ncbi:thymidine kinase [Spirochaeta cellobiosiphila]|uniref:thymidine kinase n=1 Tax=Spirochaeta cellobiosiphila TaxID=504483 RepID=UPI00042A2A45|nr:thymidine kinase [Spirochaeta cellobiosiphila]
MSISNEPTNYFLKSLGFPQVQIHHPANHYDFTKPGRRILVIGPMGSGKTEYSAKIWRDSQVVLKKNSFVKHHTMSGSADRREVGFFRNYLDVNRFPDYPEDSLAYRGGYISLGDHLFVVKNSFEMERIINSRIEIGTWIIDEASFYDERLVYMVKQASELRGLNFVFPTLTLNFRNEIFNSTARLLVENATDVFPLTAYCEHPDCLTDSFHTYRYYTINGDECPSLYFDPLIIIGGDVKKDNPEEPNYCTRCDEHHHLPGKEYTYLFLKPIGEAATKGDTELLYKEMDALKNKIEESRLFQDLFSRYVDVPQPREINMNALKVSYIAEKALIYLFSEWNLLSLDILKDFVNRLNLNKNYIQDRLRDNGRFVQL